MNQKCAAFVATATAGALLFLAASCGGGSDSPADSAQSQPSTQPQQSPAGQAQQPSAGNQPQQLPAGSQPQPTIPAARYVAIDLHSNLYSGTAGNGIGDGEQVGSGWHPGINGYGHAVYWQGSASTIVDLHPNGGIYFSTIAVATSGGVQVGWGTHDDQWSHALKWTGSANSVVDLHPSGFRESLAEGVAGDQIIGVGLGQTSDGSDHALLWTSNGVVDLNASGLLEGSVGMATDGVRQVGYGRPVGCFNCSHALLWLGNANSVVDLHPVSGYARSLANGVNGGQQVGWGGDFGSEHALLWSGSAQSVVDLHPSAFRTTIAQAVAAGRQVGWGITADGSHHALLWNGTAESVMDLHLVLPPGFTWSEAMGIDASGNIIGSAGDKDGSHAILWVPR